MSGYLLPFVIVSMHLLVVLIGASYMARTKRMSPAGSPTAPLPLQEPTAAVSLRCGFARHWHGHQLVAAIKMFAVVPLRPLIAEEQAGQGSQQYLAPGSAARHSSAWAFIFLGLLFLANVLCSWWSGTGKVGSHRPRHRPADQAW